MVEMEGGREIPTLISTHTHKKKKKKNLFKNQLAIKASSVSFHPSLSLKAG
jgi:hypothetical protein